MSRYWMLCAVLLAGCAVRLGGPKPVEYRAIALRAASESAPAEVAQWIRGTEANVVLLSARADSAWFGEVAQRTSLSLSGPGEAGPVAFAFLAGEALGDTTLALPVEGGGELVVHDALYKVDKYRHLDLLATRIETPESAREAVRSLLAYVATDVMPDAGVVLAIDVPDAATGDRVAALLHPVFLDARRCLSPGGGSATTGGMRLFYGPEARLRCEGARLLNGADAPLIARLVSGR